MQCVAGCSCCAECILIPWPQVNGVVVFLGSCHIKSHALSGGGLGWGGDGHEEGSKVSQDKWM